MFCLKIAAGCYAREKYTKLKQNAVNGAPKTGVLKNGLITLRKITPSDARNSQQLFRVEKK